MQSEAMQSPSLRATIARIQQIPPVFIGISVRTRRGTPTIPPTRDRRPRRGRLSPGGRGARGVRAGRVTPEQNARRCDTSPPAEQLRLVALFVRPCASHQGDAHGRKQLPHVTVDVLNDGGFYREVAEVDWARSARSASDRAPAPSPVRREVEPRSRKRPNSRGPSGHAAMRAFNTENPYIRTIITYFPLLSPTFHTRSDMFHN